MEKDLFLLLLALILSVVLKNDLFRMVAIVDTAYRLTCLIEYACIHTGRKRNRKSPSSSAKRDGRLR